MPDGDGIKRLDIAATEWKGPQDEVIGWWKCRMPDAATKKLRPAPNGVLLDTLYDLISRPGKETLAYLLAVLLVRRKVLSEDTSLSSVAKEENPDSWCLVCQADDRQWNVPVVLPTAENMDSIQEELNSLLFTEE